MMHGDRTTRRRGAGRLAVVVALALAACGGEEATEQESRDGPPPSVVLVCFDTLRADRLGVYGYTDRDLSPRLDALARDGVLFETCIAAAPWTVPSIMSLLTSLHPSSHGLVESFSAVKREILAERGTLALADEHRTLAEVLRDAGFATAAFTGGVTVDADLGFGRGFDTYATTMFKLGEENVVPMLEWISRHAEQPFFLLWHTFEVHSPYLQGDLLDEVVGAERAAAIAPALERMHDELVRESPAVGENTSYSRRLRALLQRHDAFDRDVCEALYRGGVRSADAWLGRLLDHLRDEGLYDRALVVLCSDHGECFAEHGPQFYEAHGHSLYEELLRVPLVVKLPGNRHAGRRVADVVRGVDVMPTVLDVLGVAADPSLQGVSLRPLWERGEAPDGGARDGGADAERAAFSEALLGASEQKSVRTSRYKYIVTVPPGVVETRGRAHVPEQPAARELYDLHADPAERRNLLDEGAADEDAAVSRTAGDLDRVLRRYAAAGAARPERVPIDPELLEQLEAIGYVSESDG